MTSRESYDATPGVNWSTLRELRRSPRHYRHALTVKREETDAMRLGSATHCAVLEPDRFPLAFAVWDGGRRAGKDWTAFCDANAGRTVLTRDQYAVALAIRDAVRSHPAALSYLADLETEVTIAWTDARTGIACKGRIDGVTKHPALLDLKTAREIAARHFAATAWRSGYVHQLAFYRAGVSATRGNRIDGWPCAVLAVENTPPYDVALLRVDDDALYAAEEDIKRLPDARATCRATDKWPGQYPDEQVLKAPAWAFTEDGDGDLNAPAAWLMGAEEAA